ncbi:MAG: hypothetical protein Q3996_00680 [Candidatus Saccharibacteria bacterium]|nr:hypothetical protein [Candidatus Saccharibacteria bacterium]
MNNPENTNNRPELKIPDIERWRRERIQREQQLADEQEEYNSKRLAKAEQYRQRQAEKLRRQQQKFIRKVGLSALIAAGVIAGYGKLVNKETSPQPTQTVEYNDDDNFTDLDDPSLNPNYNDRIYYGMDRHEVDQLTNHDTEPHPRTALEYIRSADAFKTEDSDIESENQTKEQSTNYVINEDDRSNFKGIATEFVLKGVPEELLFEDNQPTIEKVFDLENAGKFKSFMSYATITNRTSEQWFLQQSKNSFSTDQGLRAYNYHGKTLPMIAVGTSATDTVGKLAQVTFGDGESQSTHLFVVGDIKKNLDTLDDNLTQNVDGSVVEFIVDQPLLTEKQSLATTMGDLSYYKDDHFNFSGNVEQLVIFNETVDFDSPNHNNN